MSWPLVAIKDVARVITGKTPSKSEEDNFGGEIPFVTPAELNGSAYVSYTPQTITEKGASKLKLVPRNSVMVCCIGSLGKLAIADREVATNQQINSVVFDAEKVNPKYGYYALSKLKPIMEKLAPSTTVAIINKSNFEALEIPLPPLAEQQRIAAILDKADAIRRKRQQAIQLADEFLRAVFLDMFGDPVTNPKGWEVKTLASITKDWRGGASIKPDDFTDSGFPVLHKGAIHQHGKIVLDESKKTFVSNEFAEAKKGSLVGRDCVAITLRDLVPSGPSIGLMADLSDYATSTYLLSQGAYGFCVKPEELHAAYLVALSNHDGFRQEFKKISVGSTQIHIRSSDLKELALPVPPVELQRKYGAIRRTVINFQKKAASGEEQGELFDSLSQKAFRGEL